MKQICCFGEVLWDILPHDEVIGGAPLNVALRLQSLGNKVHMISSIGKDERGRGIKEYLKNAGVSTKHLQLHQELATGAVDVQLSSDGVATYTIEYPKAWDKILFHSEMEPTVANADAFVFGSLSVRDEVSEDTLRQLLSFATYKVFDVNLRPPHYVMERLEYFLKAADLLKFNEEEITEICENLNFFGTMEDLIIAMNAYTEATTICVTRGHNGAILYHNESFFYNSGYEVSVVDTIGAGDSFLATIVHCLLNHTNPQEALDRACAMGSLVASKSGANPIIEEVQLQEMLRSGT